MTFFESIKTVFSKYAEFGGRASRPEFWWFALFSFLVSIALTVLMPLPMHGRWGHMMFEGAQAGPMLNLAGFWSVAVFLPSLAVAIRRLRDAGRDWTNIFWLFLPIAGIIVLIVHWSDPSVAQPAAVAAKPAASKAAVRKPAASKAATPKK